MTARPVVGVLALQGDVREHLRVLVDCGTEAISVRRASELDRCDGLIVPGGESTTMVRLARTFELLEPLRTRIADGMPAFGTCAGMILLADRILDAAPGQETIGGLDVTVRRNAFGRQIDSFETELNFAGIPTRVPATFIRAPWVEEAGPEVHVLARVEADPATQERVGRIVAVRQGSLMATSFHPEVGGDSRVHAQFVELVRG